MYRGGVAHAPHMYRGGVAYTPHMYRGGVAYALYMYDVVVVVRASGMLEFGWFFWMASRASSTHVIALHLNLNDLPDWQEYFVLPQTSSGRKTIRILPCLLYIKNKFINNLPETRMSAWITEKQKSGFSIQSHIIARLHSI